MASTKSSPEKQDPWPNVLEAIKGLREGYKVGCILKEKGKLMSHSQDTGIAALAARYGHYPEAGRKLRKFATLYSKKDVDELCELCRTHHSAFGVSKVFLLLPIKDEGARRDFQKAAVQGHWQHTRILLELRRQFGREPAKRGRKPQRPGSTDDALAQLLRLSVPFRRWYEHNFQAEKKPVHLPEKVQTALNAAAAAVKTLYEAADTALKREQQAKEKSKQRRRKPSTPR